MSVDWLSSMWVALSVQLVTLVIFFTVGNPVLIKRKAALTPADGMLVLKPDTLDFLFIAVVLLAGSGLGFLTTGWPRYAIFASFGACLGLAWRAYGHRIILTNERMTVLSWRRFDVSKAEIVSYHVERESEWNHVLWIEVHAAQRKCQLPRWLLGTWERKQAVLAFLGEDQQSGQRHGLPLP